MTLFNLNTMEDVGVVLHYELKGTYSTQNQYFPQKELKSSSTKRGKPIPISCPLHHFTTLALVKWFPQKVTGRPY